MSNDAAAIDTPPAQPKWLRRLRIGTSAFFGLLTVALCVLWVRSYWWFTAGQGQIFDRRAFAFQSLDGSVTVTFLRANNSSRMTSYEAMGFPAMRQVRDRSLNYTFRLSSNASALTIQTPFWFPAIASAIFAGAAWITFRFSLRTLLIATTLFAIVLGLSVWTSQ